MKRLDLRDHEGVHPRFGVLDVVPFVALDPARADEAIGLRDETAAWVATTFEVPVFLYGKLRRRHDAHAARGSSPRLSGPSRPTTAP